VDVLTTPAQAYEASLQFGKFTKLLNGFKAANLKITLPDFHNLLLRYTQFEMALINGNKQRMQQSSKLIEAAKNYEPLCSIYEAIKTNSAFHVRVTHHDTKISNVLFDENKKSLCVIDLDTVMRGYFISDAGDMMRTYLSPVSEEEKDFAKIEVREDFFEALAKGYLSQMKELLTADEINHFVYAGKFMIYMQALRFLTDYLNNDVYYGAKYEGNNLIRAGNQFTLLQRFIDKEQILQQIVQAL
jgi:Ser/Thr protein kinase RdoA (MazF antagonist)